MVITCCALPVRKCSKRTILIITQETGLGCDPWAALAPIPPGAFTSLPLTSLSPPPCCGLVINSRLSETGPYFRPSVLSSQSGAVVSLPAVCSSGYP